MVLGVPLAAATTDFAQDFQSLITRYARGNYLDAAGSRP
jgi:hypothetical protein